MKGAKPSPTADRRAPASRSRSQKALAVAAAPPELPAPPATLAADAGDMWRVACAELASLRSLREGDLPLVEMLVTAAYRHRQAQASIDTFGPMVKGKFGPMVNPMLRVEKDASATYLRLAETLGLTPVARLRLGVTHLAGQSMLAELHARLGID